MVVGSTPSIAPLERSGDLPAGSSTVATTHVTGGGPSEASASFAAEVRFIDNKEKVTSSSYLPHRRGYAGAASSLIPPPCTPGTVNRKHTVSARVPTFTVNGTSPIRAFTVLSSDEGEKGSITGESPKKKTPRASTPTTSRVGVSE